MKLVFDKSSCEILGLEYENMNEKVFLTLDLYVESSTETDVFLQVVDMDDQSTLFSAFPELCEKLEIECYTMPKPGTRLFCRLCL
ncbi:hypothetical protein GMAR_ORF164 [Golden Marseillevirus]|uniref:hypothetical protein n=1 Tax=Golden Marseillevirus TaxID=1720526 RepID=UPI000877A923|nr:hypothetical protein GMAR_ORF164 [Golden Marseillevirus]ALX27538.1 hypothetical protein GMAR_ORF164 [Golden Marseillevirus]